MPSHLLLCIPVLLCLCSLCAHAQNPAVQPLRGLYYTAADLEQARQRLDSEPWRRELADRVIAQADEWLKRDDDWIRSILPAPGSLFAYGKSGCPACGASWKSFGEGLCSFERPGQVVCSDCGQVFPPADPASPYHDDGDGVTINGKTYFAQGVWNAYVIQSLHAAFSEDACALSILAHAYAFTGNPDYARKALVIMDALATLSPTTRGPRDFDQTGRLDSDQGRLHFLTSITYRAMIPLARDFDLVGAHPFASEPSPTSPGSTVAANIRTGLFEDYLFKHHDVRNGRLTSLHNHEADSVRAMLAVGLLFGVADYIRWGFDSLDALISNTIDRDGMYYETSVGYTGFTRGVFVDMAELCANYNPANYAGIAGDFPDPRNFFANSKLTALTVDNIDISIAGHEMNYGNGPTDRAVVTAAGSRVTPWTAGWLAKFLVYAPEEFVRSRAAEKLAAVIAGREAQDFGSRWWALKNPLPLPSAAAAALDSSPVGPARFYSTKGIAAFQMGHWPHRRAMLVRGGPGLPHAQDDLLQLAIFDAGRELAAELGYGVFGSHLHKGWGTRAIAHNLVVIDADSGLEGGEYFKKSPGADWRGFYDGGTLKYLDTDAASQFPERQNVSQYRRRVAAVQVDDQHSYYIDVFDISGGETRDYSFHAPYNDTLKETALRLEGVNVRPVDGAWTLAGLEDEFRHEPWNAPGRSWGERVTSGEYLKEMEGGGEVGGYGWLPPGRGYGFLYNLKGAETSKPWSATWELEGKDEAHLRLTVLPTGHMHAFRAAAPDLSGRHVLNYVIARHGGTTTSRFVTVVEPYQGERVIQDIHLLHSGSDGVAVEVVLRDGSRDYLSFNSDAATSIRAGRGVQIQGEFGMVRLSQSGQPQEAHLYRGRSITSGTTQLLTSQPSFTAEVAGLTPDLQGVVLDTAESLGGLSQSGFAIFSSPRYSHNTALQFSHADLSQIEGQLVLKTGDVVLQQVKLAGRSEDGVYESALPLPLAYIHERPTRFLDGKLLMDASNLTAGPVGRLEECLDLKTLRIDEEQGELSGRYAVVDFAPGDNVEFPIGKSWRRTR